MKEVGQAKRSNIMRSAEVASLTDIPDTIEIDYWLGSEVREGGSGNGLGSEVGGEAG